MIFAKELNIRDYHAEEFITASGHGRAPKRCTIIFTHILEVSSRAWDL